MKRLFYFQNIEDLLLEGIPPHCSIRHLLADVKEFVNDVLEDEVLRVKVDRPDHNFCYRPLLAYPLVIVIVPV